MVKKLFLIFILTLSLSCVFALNSTNQSNLSIDEISEDLIFLENIVISNDSLNTSIDEKQLNNLFKKSDKDYQININGKKVLYDELNSKKISKLNKASKKTINNKQYYLVQFYNKLSREDVLNLKKEGITILSSLGNNAYYVSFRNTNLLKESKNKKFENLAVDLEINNLLNGDNAVRSIENIDKDFKLSKNLRENKVENWAKDKDGNVYLTVQFHKDVTLDEAEKLMNEKGFDVISRLESINALTIKVYGGEQSE